MSPDIRSSFQWSTPVFLALLFIVAISLSNNRPARIENVYTLDSSAIERVSNKSGPELSGYWVDPPDIKICSNVRVKKSRIETAVRFWERLGYEFGEISTSDEWRYNPSGCLARPGEITFRIPSQDISFVGSDGTNYLAITRTYRVTETSEIIAADIFVQNEADYSLERIVEHELGHAMGWLHQDSSYHIMHSEYQRTGHRSSGVHHNDYVAFGSILMSK